MAPPVNDDSETKEEQPAGRHAAICCPRCGIGTPLDIRRNSLACPTCSYRSPLPVHLILERLGAPRLPLLS
ncbi:MAG: hypothetical protein KDE28_14215 [Anaerolineales bacterium]|nr:hypothetical protein [Anaerolineales bacterium]